MHPRPLPIELIFSCDLHPQAHAPLRQPVSAGWQLVRVGCLLLLAAQVAGARAGAVPEARAVLSVEAAPLMVRNWHQTVAASGPVAAWQEIDASALVSGLRILKLTAEIGTIVREGQLLAKVDTGALEINAAALRADLAQSRALAEQATANLKRAGQVVSGGLSEQEMLDYRTHALTAKAQMEAAAARLAAVNWQIAHADVVAPDDGQVSDRTASVGAVTTTGQQLFKIIRKRRLEWRGQLDARQVGLIAPGQHVVLALPDGAVASARIRQIAPAMNTQNRMGSVFADIDNPTGRASPVRAGMYADGVVELAPRPTLTLPSSAVFVRDGHDMVAQVLPRASSRTATVRMRAVRTGQRIEGAVEIVSGLNASALAVAQGASFLADGDTVNIIQPADVEKQRHSRAPITPARSLP